MIGRIAVFNGKDASGVIKSESGDSVGFDVSGVLAYDVSGLAAGQIVHFDLARGNSQTAVNVSTYASRTSQFTEQRNREIGRLRYLGFRQQGNVRAYHFERISSIEDKQSFTVDIDMVLFKRHHVVIQEGPALCLELLSAELERVGIGPWPLEPCCITDQHMLAYLAGKPAYGAKNVRKANRSLAAVFSHSA